MLLFDKSPAAVEAFIHFPSPGKSIIRKIAALVRSIVSFAVIAPLITAITGLTWLRWTDGRHIQPGRNQVVEDLLRIADEELPLPTIGVSRDR